MRKFFTMVILAGAGFILAACGDEANQPSEAAPAAVVACDRECMRGLLAEELAKQDAELATEPADPGAVDPPQEDPRTRYGYLSAQPAQTACVRPDQELTELTGACLRRNATECLVGVPAGTEPGVAAELRRRHCRGWVRGEIQAPRPDPV